MKENYLKTRLFFILMLIVYIFGWVLYIYLDYSTRKNEVIKNIDLRLYNTAISLKYILPDDLHDRAIDKQAISIEEDLYIVRKLINLTKETGIKYAYTIIKQEEKLFFVATVVLTNTERGTYYFLDYTEEADKAFFEAFNRTTPTYQTVSDQWGKVRTVMIPQTSPGGIKYLACADYDIGYVKELLQENLLRSITIVFFFVFLSVLIIVFYIKIRNRYFVALKDSEKKFRNIFEHTTDYILILEPGKNDELIIIDFNEAACKKHSYLREELLGKLKQINRISC
jgi:PAS domain-containing protein